MMDQSGGSPGLVGFLIAETALSYSGLLMDFVTRCRQNNFNLSINIILLRKFLKCNLMNISCIDRFLLLPHKEVCSMQHVPAVGHSDVSICKSSFGQTIHIRMQK